MNSIHIVSISSIIVLLLLDIVAIVYILFRKISTQLVRKEAKHIARQIVEEFPRLRDEELIERYRRGHRRFLLLEQYVETRQALRVHEKLDRRVRNLLAALDVERYYIRRLEARSPLRRIAAAVYLGHIGGDSARVDMEHRLKVEKKWVAKLHLAYALSELRANDSIVPIVESLIGAPHWYQNKVWLFIADFGHLLYPVLPDLMLRPEIEVRFLIIHVAAEFATSALYDYLKKAYNASDENIRHAAARSMTVMYPSDPLCREMLQSDEMAIRECAVTAIGSQPTKENAGFLLDVLNGATCGSLIVTTISRMCGKAPLLLEFLMHRYTDPRYASVKEWIVEILSNRVDYFIMKLGTSDHDTAKPL